MNKHRITFKFSVFIFATMLLLNISCNTIPRKPEKYSHPECEEIYDYMIRENKAKRPARLAITAGGITYTFFFVGPASFVLMMLGLYTVQGFEYRRIKPALNDWRELKCGSTS